MSGTVHDLYQNQVYPPMSHPLSDPAVSSVAARLGGLESPHPRHARILEIGCCSGHNLLPLAARWPDARLVGIDLAERSIQEARVRADLSGLGNVQFHAVDLVDFQPGEPYDYIIAHGFFSWVPDEVKAALLLFCRNNLTCRGIATVSFNLECGWKARLPVIAKAKAILAAGAEDIMSALAILMTLTAPEDPEHAIIHDMMAKGPSILAFDDFGPVNDPWPIDGFARAAAGAGLKWLGESAPGENIPQILDEDSIGSLRSRFPDPLAFQQSLDEASGRTFRSGVLCRDDAPAISGRSIDLLKNFPVRAGPAPSDAVSEKIHQAVQSFAPDCASWETIGPLLEEIDEVVLARHISAGITRGWLLPRIEPVSYRTEPPEYPKLSAFRLLCAREKLPLVDAWHKPCTFPELHYEVLAAMDGSRSFQDLDNLAKAISPDLAFQPWLQHLTWRGMFS